MPLMRQAPGRSAEQARRVQLDGVGVILVHVPDDVGLALAQRLGTGHVDEQLRARQIDDAAEAADEMRAGNIECIKREIRKIGIARGSGVPGEEARTRGCARGRPRLADQRDARPRHRIGV